MGLRMTLASGCPNFAKVGRISVENKLLEVAKYALACIASAFGIFPWFFFRRGIAGVSTYKSYLSANG